MRNRDIKEELNILLQKGFSRLYGNGEILRIEDLLEVKDMLPLLKSRCMVQKTENVFMLIDRLVKKDFDEDDLHRISDSVSTAFYEGEGMMYWR